jgi:hypothetical protein
MPLPLKLQQKILKRANNRCERCGIDFDEGFKGEFHHIIPKVFGGEATLENCSLLCTNCHRIAPNVKGFEDLLIYKEYFLRFASFKEAAQFYNVETRMEVYVKVAIDIAKKYKREIQE